MTRATIRGLYLIGALLLGQSLWGQSYTLVNGTVADSSKAVVSGASIELQNVNTLAKRTTLSNAAGVYVLQQVPPGKYQLSVAAQGFAHQTITGLNLLINTPATVNIELTVAASAQSISVRATAEDINTTDASLGNAVGAEAVTQLPFFARNAAGLLAFQPGVTSINTNVSPSDDRNGAVNGGKSDQGNITLDGMDVNEQNQRVAFTPALRVTLDSVQEFRSTTLNATAEQGRSGGAQIALVTKSGTNSFHGSLYEYNRNTNTSANDFFLNKAGIKKPPLLVNVFGGSVGGPIKKDKLFFFANYEGRRDASNVSALRTVPSLTARQGTIQYENTSGGVSTLSPSQITNDIDPLHIGPSSAVLSLFQAYPNSNDATVGDGLTSGGYRFTAARHAKQDTYITRLDYVLGSKNTFFARGNLQNDHTGGTPQFPGQIASGVALNNSKGFVLGWTSAFRPNLVNTVHYGLTREGTDNPGTLATNYTSTIGQGWISSPLALTLGLSRILPTHQISDDLGWVHGNHNVRVGGVARFLQNRSISFSNSFSSQQLGTADLLSGAGVDLYPADLSPGFVGPYKWAMASVLGLVNFASSNYNYTTQGRTLASGAPVTRNYENNEYEFYATDAWKVTHALTVTAGLRWSLMPAVHEANGQQMSTLPSLADWFNERGAAAAEGQSQLQAGRVTYTLANSAQGRPLYPFHKDNLAPRISLAYSPQSTNGWVKALTGGPGKTAIRAGYGIFYDVIGQPLAQTFDSYAFGLTTNLTTPAGEYTPATSPRFSGFSSIPTPIIQSPPPATGFPVTPPDNLSATGTVESNLSTPYSETLDFSIERDLGAGFSIQGSYVGRLSHHQLVDRDDAEPTNLNDPAGGMSYFQGVQQLERLILKNTSVDQVAPIAFFEDVFPGAAGNGLTATQAMYNHYKTYAPDWSTALLLADTNCDPACSRLGQYAFFSPQFAGLSAWSSIGNSDYNAMQWSVRKRYSQGLLLNFNWTWSRSHDLNSRTERAGAFNNTSVNQGHLENSWNPNQSRAVSDYDMTHILNAFAVWDLPVGRGRRFSSNAGGLLNALIGGWQVAPTWSFTTGLPVSPRNARAGATDYWIVGFATIAGAKPETQTTKNGPHGPNIFPNPTAGLAAFSPTLTGIEGQRNALRADGSFDVDLGVSKRWVMPYNERHSLQLRWETFNLTNTAHFDVSSLSFRTSTASTFGTYSATMNTPRQMQFALRYEF